MIVAVKYFYIILYIFKCHSQDILFVIFKYKLAIKLKIIMDLGTYNLMVTQK